MGLAGVVGAVLAAAGSPCCYVAYPQELEWFVGVLACTSLSSLLNPKPSSERSAE